ncbi:MAG TPA: hypothetical protein VF209_01785 [Patescibacteria group bacterium]
MQNLTSLSPLYASSHFELFQTPSKKSTKLEMHVPATLITTNVLPNTLTVLHQEAPSVLKTKCFNELHLPFIEEVKNTETAHLFEHILIDYMALEKVKAGYDKATFNAVTSWNWKKNPVGFFTIDIKAGAQDGVFFQKALMKTIMVMEKIFAHTTVVVKDTSTITQVIH